MAAICFLSIGCSGEKDTFYNEFREVPAAGWQWHDSRRYTFTITDSTVWYELSCGLRITGSYSYSNIWLLYQLNGPEKSVKNQFEIGLSDQTGKWTGKGMSNLISYEKVFLPAVKLKPGTYTLELMQNMRDEKLRAVSDIGLKIRKGAKIF